MVLPDVNVLVYAHRKDASDHREYRLWLERVVNGDEAFAISELVLSGFIRVVTHTKVFKKPSPLADALAFCDQLRDQPNSVHVAPGPRHFDLFRQACTDFARHALRSVREATSSPTRTSLHWRLSQDASGSPPIGTSAASAVCVGAIH